MQSKGLDFLRPIWAMIYSKFTRNLRDEIEIEWEREIEGLNLSESEVSVTYSRYINNYKTDAQANDRTIDNAVKAQLTPGRKY